MTQTVAPDPTNQGPVNLNETPHHRPGRLMAVSTRFALLGVWALLAIVYALVVPDTFLTAGAFKTIFGSQQALVFLTAGLLCTILVGEFVDMSVASNFGLAAILVTVLNVNHGWNVWLASLAAIVVSTLVGVVNGWLVVKLGVNTIVVTLGMGTFLLGIALWVSNLTPVSGLPESFQNIANTQVLGLPVSFFYGIALMLVFAYVLKFTPLGRNMRFVGENREVSRLAGVRVTWVRMGAFIAAGLIAGVGGVLTAAATGGFDPNVSQAYLLPMFAATFLGTAVIEPGRFNPIGTWIAVYFLATGVLGLQLMGATSWVTSVFYGGVLVVAVTLTTLLHARSRAR
ncbi:monosaccharide ABC transporter membrane protein (CUT2 family) [Branchiibius hedensis]|uniref:Monosaccharide ABC transporter membrane protein, CUT2 family n=1 Tax=Branchiibius hedensis TaxID=672460 RepID=A0A2Y9BUF7_9MICO|nr:ABC transporter permease [Branchiibius hedensis]PWJ26821.1 monosaccharide ABC transporter membrane protein (CUT2 family) [Branchiibius hedensis]SSA35632.1 monosaccharide ABC transporter membrane protein, CUT2 family [Branchiibius hedensis]